jgi:acyl carrier protein phosphodiesterase
MPFFIIDNWLETYQTRRGIRRVLKTLSGITSLPKETRWAMRSWKKQYYSIEEDFMEFFPQLISYVESEFALSSLPACVCRSDQPRYSDLPASSRRR